MKNEISEELWTQLEPMYDKLLEGSSAEWHDKMKTFEAHSTEVKAGAKKMAEEFVTRFQRGLELIDERFPS